MPRKVAVSKQQHAQAFRIQHTKEMESSICVQIFRQVHATTTLSNIFASIILEIGEIDWNSPIHKSQKVS